MFKKIIFCFILFNLIACNNATNKDFGEYFGEWQITEFYVRGGDSLQKINYVLLGFEKNNQMWFTNFENGKDFTFCDYKISKQNSIYQVNLI